MDKAIYILAGWIPDSFIYLWWEGRQQGRMLWGVGCSWWMMIWPLLDKLQCFCFDTRYLFKGGFVLICSSGDFSSGIRGLRMQLREAEKFIWVFVLVLLLLLLFALPQDEGLWCRCSNWWHTLSLSCHSQSLCPGPVTVTGSTLASPFVASAHPPTSHLHESLLQCWPNDGPASLKGASIDAMFGNRLVLLSESRAIFIRMVHMRFAYARITIFVRYGLRSEWDEWRIVQEHLPDNTL